MARPTLDAPPAAASEGRRVGAQSLVAGVLVSHGGSVGHSVLMPGLVPVPGSGKRHDSRVGSDVSKECDSLLPMWRDAVRSLSVDTASYEPVAHVSVDADAGWETMRISPDYERVPSARIVAGNPGTSRETMPIPPDCERVPGSSDTAGATDGSWGTISIAPDRAHKPGAGVAGVAAGRNRETIPIPSDCESVPGTGGDAGNPFFVRFYVDDNILKEVRYDVPWSPLRRITFYCSAPAVHGNPLFKTA